MTGSLDMVFSGIRIPNTVAQGTFSRILLFPIEVVGQLDSLLPKNVLSWKELIVDNGSLRRQLNTVELSQGKVRLRAKDGRVQVEECAFFGDWISRLAFSGDFDLAGEQKLRLKSNLTVGGIQTTIPIEGTLDSPQVHFHSVAADSLGGLLKKIVNLKLIGTSANPSNPNKVEPVIMIDKLPSAGMIRELHQLFKELWD